jgi:hypothetical protein
VTGEGKECEFDDYGIVEEPFDMLDIWSKGAKTGMQGR